MRRRREKKRKDADREEKGEERKSEVAAIRMKRRVFTVRTVGVSYSQI